MLIESVSKYLQTKLIYSKILKAKSNWILKKLDVVSWGTLHRKFENRSDQYPNRMKHDLPLLYEKILVRLY